MQVNAVLAISLAFKHPFLAIGGNSCVEYYRVCPLFTQQAQHVYQEGLYDAYGKFQHAMRRACGGAVGHLADLVRLLGTLITCSCDDTPGSS